MVEFALVFPLVLLLTYGIIEVGRVVFIKASVTGGTREGARYGSAVGDGLHNNPQYADCAGIRLAVKNNAFLMPISDGNIAISYDRGPGGAQVAASCESLAAQIAGGNDPIQLGDRIVVHVTAAYTPVISFVGINGFNIVSENARTILVGVEFDP